MPVKKRLAPMTGEKALKAGKRLRDVLANAESAAFAVLSAGMKLAGFSKGRRFIRRKAREIAYQAANEARGVCAEELREAYEEVARRAGEIAKEINAVDVHAAIYDMPPEIPSVAETMAELDETWTVRLDHMARDIDDIYKKLNEAAAQVTEETGRSNLKAVKDALKEYADYGIGTFTDSAGRHWELQAYADMAMRTGVQRAAMRATIDSMLKYHWDLCFVNSHPGCCEKCDKWQGRIMSLTGRTAGYPTLRAAMEDGLFHPNCAHILQVYIEGYSEPGQGNPEGWNSEKNADLYNRQQKQRFIERKIRRAKRRLAMALTDEEREEATKEIRKWQLAARQNARGMVLRRNDREQVREVSVPDVPDRGLPDSALRRKLDALTNGIDNSKILTRAGTAPEIEAMPSEQFNRIVKAAARNGIEIRTNKEAVDVLDAMKVEGITFDEKLIFLYPNPSRASVFEELMHCTHYRIGAMGDVGPIERTRSEIVANSKLLKYAKAYKLTQLEIDRTERNLKDYLKVWLIITGREWDNDVNGIK